MKEKQQQFHLSSPADGRYVSASPSAKVQIFLSDVTSPSFYLLQETAFWKSSIP